ncbi:hypothetical protein CHU92_00060 [Flavobacterium cyanobacteriorum]|uniref:Redoxin domain-containing protein n=1 Tax=Flavobacterium cyanobacteriorum TaxID=2022802 RepID=A0A256AA14_9FLAO|nr:hypothetical protein CHU92_00060 [Flavobacterium cyanobacteriorum]
MPKLLVYDEVGNSKFLNDLGETIVLDVWTTSCATCIKEFPKFQKVATSYKNHKVKFYSLNFPLRRDTQNYINKFTEQYTFKKLIADRTTVEKLNIKYFPQYIIIKNNKIQYIGSLNINKSSILVHDKKYN